LYLFFTPFLATEKENRTENRRVASKTVRTSLQRKTQLEEENFFQEREISLQRGKAHHEGEVSTRVSNVSRRWKAHHKGEKLFKLGDRPLRDGNAHVKDKFLRDIEIFQRDRKAHNNGEIFLRVSRKSV
jgi:uncharacterized membrane protein